MMNSLAFASGDFLLSSCIKALENNGEGTEQNGSINDKLCCQN